MPSFNRLSKRGAALVVGSCVLVTFISLGDLISSSLFVEEELSLSNGRRMLEQTQRDIYRKRRQFQRRQARRRRPRTGLARAPAPVPEPASRELFEVRGVGPELSGLDGRVYKLGDIPGQGITWYNMLSSPRVQWNMAPYSWQGCPRSENTFVGNTGFTFHEPDPSVFCLCPSSNKRSTSRMHKS